MLWGYSQIGGRTISVNCDNECLFNKNASCIKHCPLKVDQELQENIQERYKEDRGVYRIQNSLLDKWMEEGGIHRAGRSS